jgi:hypothetical protein
MKSYPAGTTFLVLNSTFKIQTLFMKKALAFLLFFCFLISVQAAQPRTFLRLYDINGNKIASGYLSGTTDSSVILQNGKERIEILSSQIDVIKTRHIINRILRQVLAVLILLAIVVLLVFIIVSIFKRPSSNPQFPDLTGSGNTKKVKKIPKVLEEYKIDNNADSWRQQRALLNRLL